PRAAKGKGCPGYGSSGLSWRRGDRRTCCSLRIGEIQEQYYCLLLSRPAIYILLADLKKRLIKPIYTPTFYQHSINFAIGSRFWSLLSMKMWKHSVSSIATGATERTFSTRRRTNGAGAAIQRTISPVAGSPPACLRCFTTGGTSS